ncbi:MAG: DUF2892 domain-containing protein [Chitinophagales bacterium]
MKRNIGNADRIIRAIVAIVFAYLILSGTVTGILSMLLGIVSGILLLTAVSGCSLIYLPFHFSTRAPHQDHSIH